MVAGYGVLQDVSGGNRASVAPHCSVLGSCSHRAGAYRTWSLRVDDTRSVNPPLIIRSHKAAFLNYLRRLYVHRTVVWSEDMRLHRTSVVRVRVNPTFAIELS